MPTRTCGGACSVQGPQSERSKFLFQTYDPPIVALTRCDARHMALQQPTLRQPLPAPKSTSHGFSLLYAVPFFERHSQL